MKVLKMKDKTDQYIDEFFQKQKEGTATIDDIPVVKKMNNDEKLTEKDLKAYALMLAMGIIEGIIGNLTDLKKYYLIF